MPTNPNAPWGKPRPPNFGRKEKSWDMSMPRTVEMAKILELSKGVQEFLIGLEEEGWIAPDHQGVDGLRTEMHDLWERIWNQYIANLKNEKDISVLDELGLAGNKSKQDSVLANNWLDSMQATVSTNFPNNSILSSLVMNEEAEDEGYTFGEFVRSNGII